MPYQKHKIKEWLKGSEGLEEAREPEIGISALYCCCPHNSQQHKEALKALQLRGGFRREKKLSMCSLTTNWGTYSLFSRPGLSQGLLYNTNSLVINSIKPLSAPFLSCVYGATKLKL